MEITATQSTAAQTATSNDTSSQKGSNTEQLANEETFLQLLVAQIRNQDPLNPADGIQFVTQLAQFSQLEQLIGIRSEIGGLGGSATTDGATGAAAATDAAGASDQTSQAVDQAAQQ